MSEQNLNKNEWAEKLQHLQVPDVSESWNAMMIVLEKELPVLPKNDRRIWWLLLFLLLFLGICNCPGTWRANKAGMDYKTVVSSETTHHRNNKPVISHPSAKENTRLSKRAGDSVYRNTKDKRPNGDQQGLHAKRKNVIHSHITRRVPKHMPLSTDTVYQNKSVITEDVEKAAFGKDTKRLPMADSVKQDSVFRPNDIRTDTTTLKKKDSSTAPIAKDSSSKKKGRFEAGIGLNHFFPIGEQRRSDFNSSGTSGVLTDYIPVPQLKYNFNNKVYVQLELQFNTPQYTRQLLIKQVLSDSIPSGQRLQHSVFIKKLFYFNVPLSVHYSPAKNFYVGAGVQFARLNNAVALLEDKQIAPNRPDSVKSSNVQGIKTDSAYQLLRTSEWRLMLDASYHWNKLTFGVRYNQALSHFINVPVSRTVITQARNSSLQVYLRWRVWKE